MRQVLFELPILGGIKIYGYGMMLVLAFLSSTWLAAWRARREKLNPELILDMAFWVFLLGLVGARLFYSIQYWGRGINSLLDVVQYWKGGIVYYGGILGGAIAFFGFHHFRPFPLRPYFDVLAPSIAVGTFFGRIGCFLNGCCYGDPCHLPWAVAFPPHSPPWERQTRLGIIPPDAEHSLPLHPTQLYSALDSLLLFFLLSAYYPLRRRDGEVLGVLILAYPISRFLIEYLRNDEGVFLLGLTISQTISVALLLGAFAYWLWLARFPRVRHADLPVAETEPARS